MTATSKEEDGNTKIASLTPETQAILHQSILNYLHRSGFTKTLKRFQYEAQIQNDTWKASSACLEDIYSKYTNACRHTEDNVVVQSETKEKKKKKNKHDSASVDETKETKSDALKKPINDTLNELDVNDIKKKTKDKKRKSNQQKVCTEENGEVDSDEAKEDKKSSKKRKRLVTDENGHQSSKMETNQTAAAAKEDEADVSDAHRNEKLEINGEAKSGSQKSVKKQRNGSAEPKTINAFQRVKIDEVEFAHEKLQDNSYWAKDGADVGYGAKAQEVLGQVRGRDFRHEKTKKKRGSYRGGQIDLQSHSIKFDYSDEE